MQHQMQMQNQFLAQQQQRQQYIQHQQNQQAHEARAEQARAAQQDRLERERQHQQTMVQQQQLTTLKLQRQELMRQQEDLTRQQEEIDAHALESLRTSRAVFVSPAALSLGDAVGHGPGAFDVTPLPQLPTDLNDAVFWDSGELANSGFRRDYLDVVDGVDSGASGASDQTGGGPLPTDRGDRRSIPPPVPLMGVAAPRGRPLIGVPGSKTSVTAQNTSLGHPMGVPAKNASGDKIAVDEKSLKVRMRLTAHDAGLRKVAPECVTAMSRAVCAYVQRVAREAVAARDARVKSGGVKILNGEDEFREKVSDDDDEEEGDYNLETLEAKMLGADVRREPTVRIEDLFAAMRKDPDPAMRGHVERVGLSLAEESALESALGGAS